MSVDLFQRADGSLGLAGTDGTATSGFIPVSFTYNVPAADLSFFVADRPYRVVGIRGAVDVAGTGGACTAVIRKVPSGTALASGTALHASTFNLVGTASTTQTLTVSTTDAALAIAAGDRIAFDLTGTATSATGCITVHLAPA